MLLSSLEAVVVEPMTTCRTRSPTEQTVLYLRFCHIAAVMVYPAAPGLVVAVALEEEIPAAVLTVMAMMAQHSVQEACLLVLTVAQVALAVELAVVGFGVAVAVAPVTSVDRAVMAGMVLALIMDPADKVARVTPLIRLLT